MDNFPGEPPEVLLRAARIVPIVNFATLEENHAAIDTLAAGGALLIEIVLRTDHAAQTLAEARQRHPAIRFAGGTVLDTASYRLAKEAGAHLAISPGLPDIDPELRMAGPALVPGAATPTEIMRARAEGFTALKIFPAETSNARAMLADLAPVFPNTGFMPTGRISAAQVPDYLALPNVLAVGGTFMFVRTATGIDFVATSARMAALLSAAAGQRF